MGYSRANNNQDFKAEHYLLSTVGKGMLKMYEWKKVGFKNVGVIVELVNVDFTVLPIFAHIFNCLTFSTPTFSGDKKNVDLAWE